MKIRTIASEPFYHGSAVPVVTLTAHRLNDDGVGLCLSRSPNVARRYGMNVSRFWLPPCQLDQLSIEEWFSGINACPQMDGTDGILVVGDRSSYDFPVDMLAMTNLSLLQFDKVLTPEEVYRMDDGLPLRHEPEGPSDRGWKEWVWSCCGGDVQQALAELAA